MSEFSEGTFDEMCSEGSLEEIGENGLASSVASFQSSVSSSSFNVGLLGPLSFINGVVLVDAIGSIVVRALDDPGAAAVDVVAIGSGVEVSLRLTVEKAQACLILIIGSYSGCSFETGVCPLFVLFMSSGRIGV